MTTYNTTYRGRRVPLEGCTVEVIEIEEDSGRASVYPLQHHVRHSPTGFEWGYLGDGPSDLARSILIHAFGENLDLADKLYQQFKEEVVARLPPDTAWALTLDEVLAWAREVTGQRF